MATRAQLADLDFGNAGRISGLLDGSAPQDAATVAQLTSAVEGLAWKDSVRAASTANVTVSNPGTAVFDTVTLVTNDRLLLKNQTAQPENGLYIFNGSGVALTRSLDASTWTELEGAVVTVEEGAVGGGTTWRQTQVNGVLGTNNLVFTAFGTSAPAASETTAGIAELATQAETDAGTDDLRIVTPLKLATYAGRKLKFAQDIGDGSATSITVTHNLNTRDLDVTVRRNSGNFDQVDCEVRYASVNTITFLFNTAPTAAQFRVTISG